MLTIRALHEMAQPGSHRVRELPGSFVADPGSTIQATFAPPSMTETRRAGATKTLASVLGERLALEPLLRPSIPL